VIFAVPFIGRTKTTDEKAKAVGERYNGGDDTPPDKFGQQWDAHKSRDEIDREEQVGGYDGIKVSVPVNKVWKWIKRKLR